LEEIKRALKENKLFKDLPEDALDYIAPYINLREFKKGRIIFFEGDRGKMLYLIKKGRVVVFKKDDKGDDKILAYLKRGDFIGEMALIEENLRSASCRTEEDTELLLFTKRAFDEIVEKSPGIACLILKEIAKTLSERLRETSTKIL
jgi:CRP-like cAMP-binding protein